VVTIRDLSPSDYGSAAELFATAFPDRAREPAAWADEEHAQAVRRWVAVDPPAEQFLGYGVAWQVRPGKFRMDLVVRTEARRRGIGGRLLAHLTERAREVGAATLQARAASEAIEAGAFLARRAFVETMRMHRLVLRVAEANLAPFGGLEMRLAAAAIRITTLREEQRVDPAWWEKLHDLYNAAREDWPDPDPGPNAGVTGEQFRRLWERFPCPPEAVFLAKRGDRYLGFTGGVGTGVRPADRNRGIATALKVRAVAWARDRGAETVATASGHPAMLRVNEKLGFRRIATEVRLVKRLREAAPGEPPRSTAEPGGAPDPAA
jgi:GNAT superfamily N-acetyltransferase